MGEGYRQGEVNCCLLPNLNDRLLDLRAKAACRDREFVGPGFEKWKTIGSGGIGHGVKNLFRIVILQRDQGMRKRSSGNIVNSSGQVA